MTSNLPFGDWTSVLGSERLTGALLDRLTHHVCILTMNGRSAEEATDQDMKTIVVKIIALNSTPACTHVFGAYFGGIFSADGATIK